MERSGSLRPVASRPRPGIGRSFNSFSSSSRFAVLGLARVLSATLPAAVSASPIPYLSSLSRRDAASAWEERHDAHGSQAWVLYFTSACLVLLGGAFAGLTIALMGQDSIYLQVLARDETDPQQKNAKRVYDLLQRGKHWVLVTLLLSNVIVNETLPVVLDRCLGGGVAAVVGSTLLIVVFGEVLPQSICVRYGLQIGGIMAKPVLALMWLLAPIAWPTAKVLDRALGEDHGTVYKKSGLKTLVTLHRSLGDVSERLNQDEVTIISAVLDLKEKPVSNVMTPMEDVFTMSEDQVLDEPTMDLILSAGYSRIPIHEPQNPTNFIGMLLVKILITYDPDDKKLVSEFPLATLPETRPETSCLDIVNFFQEGKSHMVLVSQYPGEDHGALGVVTLEDVIEELIGEEIIDESDVYIDVHKAIRRLQPAPRARPLRNRSLAAVEVSSYATAGGLSSATVAAADSTAGQQYQILASNASNLDAQPAVLSASPKAATLMMRRYSAGTDGRITSVPVRTNIDEVWQHLRHLGPSNRAANPKETRSTTVKIKTSVAGPRPIVAQDDLADNDNTTATVIGEDRDEHAIDDECDETTGLLSRQQQQTTASGRSSPRLGYGARDAAPPAQERPLVTPDVDIVQVPVTSLVDTGKTVEAPVAVADADANAGATAEDAEVPAVTPAAAGKAQATEDEVIEEVATTLAVDLGKAPVTPNLDVAAAAQLPVAPSPFMSFAMMPETSAMNIGMSKAPATPAIVSSTPMTPITVAKAPAPAPALVPVAEDFAPELHFANKPTAPITPVVDTDNTFDIMPPKDNAPHSPISLHSKASRTSTGGTAARSIPDSPASGSGSGTVMASVEHTPILSRMHVRSGSITEQVVETGGIRKVVLETSNSAEEEEVSVIHEERHIYHVGRLFSPALITDVVSGAGEGSSSHGHDSSAEMPKPTLDAPKGSQGSGGASSMKKKNRRKKRKNTRS